MSDITVWVTKPVGGDVPGLEALGDEVRELRYVSEVRVGTEGGLLSVSFEGDRTEQDEIEHAIRKAGYEVFKVSYKES